MKEVKYMKKIISILLVLLLAGCSSNKQEDKKLSIVVPSGAPSLAFYNELNNDNFYTGDASSILPQMKGESGPDIVVIDTVNGIKAISAGAQYKLAANITFGNFFIAATGNDENDVMEDGDYIVLFSQGATPDLVFHYIYGNSFDSNIHYVQAVSDASACLIKGINISDDERTIDEDPYVDYVMIAEPALSLALSKNENASIYANIQDEYYSINGNNTMVQASVFVSNRLTDVEVESYLKKLSSDIETLLSSPDVFSSATSELADEEIKDIFGIANASLAGKVLKNNSIGLGYKKAYDNSKAIDSFISLFGLKETNEEIYFK